MKVVKRVDHKSSHHKKKKYNCMVMDVNWTYCGYHFAIYTNIESLCCIAETNRMYMLIMPQFFKKERNVILLVQLTLRTTV